MKKDLPLPFALKFSHIKRSCLSAFVAGADFPQVIIGVNAGIVAIAPSEMKGVIPYDVDGGGVDDPRHLVCLDQIGMRPLVDAGSAPAGKAQITAAVHASGTVTPYNGDNSLAGLDVLRHRVRLK